MKVYIWGIGAGLSNLMHYVKNEDDICGYIDSFSKADSYLGKAVLKPAELLKTDYDLIIVAAGAADAIEKQCKEMGIDLDKVLFIWNNCEIKDKNSDSIYKKAENVLKIGGEIIQKRYHLVRGNELDEMELLSKYGNGIEYNDRHSDMYEYDYVRIRTFELLAAEILQHNVKGAVAELGVFRGEFAKYINAAFSDRKCYLFDTFSGFDREEAVQERNDGNCNDSFIEYFKNTSINSVLEKMPHRNNVIIKQGLFPESLDGLEEKFAFVSLDVDFEISIYEGLKYFYPRLNEGGCLFIHDYNSRLSGVKKAVDRYEIENNIMLKRVPVCDVSGTLIIMK